MQKFYASINLVKLKKKKRQKQNGTHFTEKYYNAF